MHFISLSLSPYSLNMKQSYVLSDDLLTTKTQYHNMFVLWAILSSSHEQDRAAFPPYHYIQSPFERRL